MNLSWGGPMDWIAEKLLSFLIYLKGLCGSYGWSIIIITVIVRMLFWPITQKANKSNETDAETAAANERDSREV